MMVGYPGETAEDMEKSLAFVRETQPTRCCVSQVTPFPGTHLWDDNREDVIAQDWDKVARHIFRPKFRSLAPNQRLIDYYQIAMTKEWGEPLMFDQIERSGWLARVSRQSPYLFHILMRRWPWLARFVTRKGRRYYSDLNEALNRVRGGEVGEGIDALERLARRFPREAEPLGHLGWVCLTTGRYDRAIRHLERLLKLNPGDEAAQSHLERAREEKAGAQTP
jgi:tetratricopeptide (TPR) repeat protein